MKCKEAMMFFMFSTLVSLSAPECFCAGEDVGAKYAVVSSSVSIFWRTADNKESFVAKGVIIKEEYVVFPYHILFALKEKESFQKEVFDYSRMRITVSRGGGYPLVSLPQCDSLSDTCVGRLNGKIPTCALEDNYAVPFPGDKLVCLDSGQDNFVDVLYWKDFGRMARWFLVKSRGYLVPGTLLYDTAGRVTGMVVFSSSRSGCYWVLPFSRVYRSVIQNREVHCPARSNILDDHHYSVICGVSFYLDNDLAAAMRSFHLSAADVSSAFYAYAGLGITCMTMGDYPSAADYFERAVKLNPSSVEMYFNIALVNNAMGLTDEAVSNLQKVVELDAEFGDAYYCLALIEGRQERYSEAKKYFEKAIVLEPFNPDVYYDYGVMCGSIGEYEEAKKYFDRAKTLYLRQRNDKALDKINKILSMFP